MKTKVVRDNCIACGNCSAICPDIYDYDEDGIAYCCIDNNEMTKEIDEEFKSLVLDAHKNCPTEAIIIED